MKYTRWFAIFSDGILRGPFERADGQAIGIREARRMIAAYYGFAKLPAHTAVDAIDAVNARYAACNHTMNLADYAA